MPLKHLAIKKLTKMKESLYKGTFIQCLSSFQLKIQESYSIAKMTAQCSENFRDSLTTPTATIPNILHGLLFRSTL